MIKSKGRHPDYVFISLLFILVFFGLIILSSASSDLGKIKFNDTYYYVKHQMIYGLLPGIIGFIITAFVHYRKIQKVAVPLLILSLIALILVFTPLGFKHASASRWLDLGPFSVQPSEFLKFTFIVYIAAWLSPKISENFGMRQNSFFAGFIPFLVISGIVALLILLQPSTTTVFIIMLAVMGIYFASGAKLYYILGFILVCVLVFSVFIAITPYRLERVKMYFNQIANPDTVSIEDKGYHLNESLIAIGSGGLFGVGYGKSTTKYRYLPEPIGDSIFAVVAEELGFVGGLFLLAVFIALFIRGFMIANNSRDTFAKLTVIGFITVFTVQTFIHIAAISGVFPLTGVPLPFVSYGGTSLAIFLTMSGMIVNISRYT